MTHPPATKSVRFVSAGSAAAKGPRRTPTGSPRRDAARRRVPARAPTPAGPQMGIRTATEMLVPKWGFTRLPRCWSPNGDSHGHRDAGPQMGIRTATEMLVPKWGFARPPSHWSPNGDSHGHRDAGPQMGIHTAAEPLPKGPERKEAKRRVSWSPPNSKTPGVTSSCVSRTRRSRSSLCFAAQRAGPGACRRAAVFV